MTGPVSSLTEEIGDELTRVVRRWHQLPLDRARFVLPRVMQVVQQLADLAADRDGLARVAVPDLGPATVMDQLRVMVYDLTRLSRQPEEAVLADVRDRLSELRRSLP